MKVSDETLKKLFRKYFRSEEEIEKDDLAKIKHQLEDVLKVFAETPAFNKSGEPRHHLINLEKNQIDELMKIITTAANDLVYEDWVEKEKPNIAVVLQQHKPSEHLTKYPPRIPPPAKDPKPPDKPRDLSQSPPQRTKPMTTEMKREFDANAEAATSSPIELTAGPATPQGAGAAAPPPADASFVSAKSEPGPRGTESSPSPPPKARKTAPKKYEVFQRLWPEHPVAVKMAEGGPLKNYRTIDEDLEKLWNIIRDTHAERLKSKGVKPMSAWKNIKPRDLEYLNVVAPDLTEEQAAAAYLAPREHWMRQALLKDVGRVDNPELRKSIENIALFRTEVSDIAFTLYKALKDNAEGWKKYKVTDIKFDAIRIIEALKAMSDRGYTDMIHKFYGERDAFDELMAESVDQEAFEGLKEVGQGGAGVVAEQEEAAPPADEGTVSSDGDSGEGMGDPPDPEANNLLTAAKFSDYSFFIRNNINKYSTSLAQHQRYDPFAMANDIPLRMKLANRASLVDGTSPDLKFAMWTRRIVNP